MTRFGRAVAGMTVASGLGMTMAALAGLYAARVLDVAEYGRLVYFLGASTMLRILGSLGLHAKLVNDLPVQSRNGKLDELNVSFYSLLAARVLTALLLLGIGSLIATTQNNELLFSASIAAIGALFYDFWLAGLAGLQRMARQIGLIFSQPVIFAVGIAVLLTRNPVAEQAADLFVLAFLFSALLGIPLVVGSPLTRPRRTSFSWSLIWSATAFTSTVYFAMLVGYAVPQYPILILGYSSFFEEAGRLGAIMNVVLLPNYVWMVALGNVYYPNLRRASVERSSEEMSHIFGKMLLILTTVNIAGVAIAALSPDWVLRVLYGDRYVASSLLLLVASPAIVLLPLNTMLTSTLIAMGRYRSTATALIAEAGSLVLLGSLVLRSSLPDISLWMAVALVASLTFAVLLQTWMVRDLVSAWWMRTRSSLPIGASTPGQPVLPRAWD